MALVLALGIGAQYLWSECQRLAAAVLTTYEWIDEIIDALENPDEDAGNRRIDELINKRKA